MNDSQNSTPVLPEEVIKRMNEQLPSFSEWRKDHPLYCFIAQELQRAREEERKSTGLPIKNYYRVAQKLREMARDKFMKNDDRSSGYYEAIKDIERYFGVGESFKYPQALTEREQV